MLSIAGADGCKAGWLVLELENGLISPSIFATAASLFAQTRKWEVLTIDIPIGLSDDGSRTCDVEARGLLGGGRASSVFPAPVRPALDATSYLEACDLSEQFCGKRLSQQAFAILPRIREIDTEIRRLETPQERVREVHPEVCFYFWAGHRPMLFGKKTPEGFQERLALTEQSFPGAYSKIRAQLQSGLAATDDILDALAALWTAQRIQEGTAVTVPSRPPLDSCGLRMEMVA